MLLENPILQPPDSSKHQLSRLVTERFPAPNKKDNRHLLGNPAPTGACTRARTSESSQTKCGKTKQERTRMHTRVIKRRCWQKMMLQTQAGVLLNPSRHPIPWLILLRISTWMGRHPCPHAVLAGILRVATICHPSCVLAAASHEQLCPNNLTLNRAGVPYITCKP